VCFRDPWRGPIPDVPRAPPGACDLLLGENQELGYSVGPWTCESGTGERMDLDCVVDVLMEIAGDRP
jgi:hypothetical protein